MDVTPRIRMLIVLAVALVAATAASLAVYRAIEEARGAGAGATVPTVVAARPLPAGVRVTAGDLKVVSWPATCPVAGALSDVEAAADRGLLAAVLENEPVTEGKLASRGEGAGLPPSIPPGMRAISVRVDDSSGVAGFVTPGTYVDVLATNDRGATAAARIVVSQVYVLAVGTRPEGDAKGAAAPKPAAVVTLRVTPADAERIATAAADGRIVLTLRNPLDTEPVRTTGTSVERLVGDGPAAPVASAPPPAAAVPPQESVYVVEAIRGSKRTRETVP